MKSVPLWIGWVGFSVSLMMIFPSRSYVFEMALRTDTASNHCVELIKKLGIAGASLALLEGFELILRSLAYWTFVRSVALHRVAARGANLDWPQIYILTLIYS